MRRPQRLIAAVVAIALSGALAGCSSSNWDPTDLLDFLDTKKKLPGERKPVFPNGVPGLEQGVPKDLYKGAAQQQDAPAVAEPVGAPKSKRAAKSKGKGRQPSAAAPAPDAEAAPEEEGSTAAAPPAPKPKQLVRRRTTAPPADAPAAQPAGQPQQSASPFPAPLPSGTFQR
jgi:hypothetical protein